MLHLIQFMKGTNDFLNKKKYSSLGNGNMKNINPFCEKVNWFLIKLHKIVTTEMSWPNSYVTLWQVSDIAAFHTFSKKLSKWSKNSSFFNDDKCFKSLTISLLELHLHY